MRNTKDFGLPQNRPRAYFVAFDRELYGELLNNIENVLPTGLSERLMRNPNLNKSLDEILQAEVPLKYYMSATYLDTLEEHAKR